MRELGRADRGGWRASTGSWLFFNTQVDARSLGQSQWLKRLECPMAEDGINVSNHKMIVSRLRV